MSRIRLITFDAYNTLFKPKGSLSIQYAQEAANVGIRVSSESITRHFGQAYRNQLSRTPFYGLAQGMTSQQWWEELVYATFKDAGVPQKDLDAKFNQLFQSLYTRFMTRHAYSVFPDVLETLEELKSHGFRMGVISNSDERLVKVVESLRLNTYFDFVLPSCVAGYEKPNAKIFEIALRRAGPDLVPEDCLHVGDDVEKDYAGAINAGWHAILLQRGKLSYEDYAPALLPDGIGRYPKSILKLQDLCPLIGTLTKSSNSKKL